jgi:hypothetical protein
VRIEEMADRSGMPIEKSLPEVRQLLDAIDRARAATTHRR